MSEDTVRVIRSDQGPKDLRLRQDKLYMYKESEWNIYEQYWEHVFYETSW